MYCLWHYKCLKVSRELVDDLVSYWWSSLVLEIGLFINTGSCSLWMWHCAEHNWRAAQQQNCYWFTSWAGVKPWWTGALCRQLFCHFGLYCAEFAHVPFVWGAWLGLLSPSSAWLLQTIQWSHSERCEWGGGDQRLTTEWPLTLSHPELCEYKGSVRSCQRVLRVSFGCFPPILLSMRP